MTLSLALGLCLMESRTAPERTVFQTGAPYSDRLNLRSDVAIVYGFDKTMPARVKSWRDKGYKVHLMTGVAWGEYQDYYYGRWDGINHEDEAQTRKNGEKVGHGGDVYYMSPGRNYGKYLAEGVRRALEVGVEAVHLEEPEFWEFGGYGAGFKREWQDYYGEPWQDPASSVDARWRAAKLMYFLYLRALQQVFDSINEYNKEKGTKVRCYVPTHSLINYAHWGIISPESSLAKLKGCNGYIAQVWTGTAREPNFFEGVKKERTFETAFLEYGSMQNLVRATGREVWYLSDPIEDNPNHDWGDYRGNYHSTLVASLLQPEVSKYEVMPWPERIYTGIYPSEADPKVKVPIPASYATELQVVINALNDMEQKDFQWLGGSHGVGVMVSDSLMFQRGGPEASDGEMGHFYGLALPFLKRGMPVQPVQLENVTLKGSLKGLKVILMTYEGMKPLTPDVHEALAKWVKAGGSLVFVDSDNDKFQTVREWWNSGGLTYRTPRLHLFEKLGLKEAAQGVHQVGKGRLVYLANSPNIHVSRTQGGADWLVSKVKESVPEVEWKESSSIILRRGPYVIAAGMDETQAPLQTLSGAYVDLFDPQLAVQEEVAVGPGARHFLVDLKRLKGRVIASAGKVSEESVTHVSWKGKVEGQADTQAVILLRSPRPPSSIEVDGKPIPTWEGNSEQKLLWIRFPSSAAGRSIEVKWKPG